MGTDDGMARLLFPVSLFLDPRGYLLPSVSLVKVKAEV